MRKLKLQVQMSIDGFMAGPNGEMDWMQWDWDNQLKNYVKDITLPIDCILLSSVLAPGFIDAWAANAIHPETADFFSKKMNDTPKVIFSKTLKELKWENCTLASGDLVEEITALKNQEGGDIIVYGGSKFVSAIIQTGLIDELHLFINPTAIGTGMPVFRSKQTMKLVKSAAFDCGIVVLHYQHL